MTLSKKIQEKIDSDWSILTAYRGSIAHGMFVPSTDVNSIDDKDLIGIIVPSKDHYFGLEEYGSRGTREVVKDEWDVVLYEIRKVISLLIKGNPNVLSILWTKDRDIISINDSGRKLRENRNLFVGQHVYFPFVGYAKSQFYKMEHQAYQGYMGDKRKGLVDKHGYDTKNAAHLIRLLRMAIEFGKTGELIVDRGNYDATELLAIKRGEWELDQVKEEANRLFKRAEDVYDRSTLPIGPEVDKIKGLLQEIVYNELVKRNEL